MMMIEMMMIREINKFTRLHQANILYREHFVSRLKIDEMIMVCSLVGEPVTRVCIEFIHISTKRSTTTMITIIV